MRGGVVVALVAAWGVLAPAAAWAAPTPTSGPAAGGTNVSDTVDGITFAQVAEGGGHTLALTPDGHLYTWGEDLYGQLGDGTTSLEPTTRPKPITPNTTYIAIAAGSSHSMAIAANGRLFAWGWNQSGQVGKDSTAQYFATPQDITPAGVTISAIAAGLEFSMALTSEGHLYTWGRNTRGQLGNGTFGNDDKDLVRKPTEVTNPDATYSAIAAGMQFAMALTSDGHLYTWGYNGYGQLGNGKSGTDDKYLVLTPTEAVSGTTYKAIATGSLHSMALGADGRVYTWGYNGYGQLGNGTSGKNVTTPQSVTPTNVSFDAIASGGNHSIALTEDGHVYAWGWNSQGQIGNGTSAPDAKVLTPAEITPDVTYTTIAANANNSLAIGSDGHTYTWGHNNKGQIGDGTLVNALTPTNITAVTVTKVAFGDASATLLPQDGNTWTATAPAGSPCTSVNVEVNYTQFGVAGSTIAQAGFTYTGTAPTVSTQPADATVSPGDRFTASVVATGDPTPSVQWQQSDTGTDPWADIAEATESTLTTTPDATTHYRAVVANCAGTVTTDAVTATVQAAPPGPPDTPSGTPTGSTPGPTARAAGLTLPWTGTAAAPLAAGAAALLLVGVTVVIAIRRRTTSTRG